MRKLSDSDNRGRERSRRRDVSIVHAHGCVTHVDDPSCVTILYSSKVKIICMRITRRVLAGFFFFFFDDYNNVLYVRQAIIYMSLRTCLYSDRISVAAGKTAAPCYTSVSRMGSAG